MTPATPDLATGTERIVQTAFQLVQSARAADTILNRVAPSNIILTDRTAIPRSYPSIWIDASEGRITHNMSMTETWAMTVAITAIVQLTKDPQKDIALARQLANRVSTIFTRDRRLGLGYVQDVLKTGFATAAARSPDERTGLYAASATVEVVYNVREAS